MEVNILNGDSLKNLLKDEYSNLLVMREALMQGPIDDKDMNDFFEKRAIFISEEYKACTKEEYLAGINEFNKIKEIKKDLNINLWFGKDVFCQVNFWFILNFLKQKIDTNEFFLITPKESQDCSFFDKEKRDKAYQKKIHITKKDLIIFCTLWKLFQKKQYSKMQKEIEEIQLKYPFLKETIKAIENLQNIEKEFKKLYKKEKNFGTFFQKICKNYSIYGYGDLQVSFLIEKD